MNGIQSFLDVVIIADCMMKADGICVIGKVAALINYNGYSDSNIYIWLFVYIYRTNTMQSEQ